MTSRIIRALLFLLFVSSAQTSQDSLAVVRDWLPSAVGDRWIYEEEIRGGNRQQPEIERWEEGIVTVGVDTIPAGMLIRRKVTFLNNTLPPPRLRAARAGESNILVQNDCVLLLKEL